MYGSSSLHHHFNPLPPFSFSCLHCSPPLDSSPSHSSLFPKPASVGVADFLQSRTFSVGSFLSLFIIPPKAPQASCEAVGSIHPGGLFFIVKHPRGCTLLIKWFSTVYAERVVTVRKQMPRLKNDGAMVKVKKREEDFLQESYK